MFKLGDMQFDLGEGIEYWCAELHWDNSTVFSNVRGIRSKSISAKMGGKKTKAFSSWDSNVPYRVSAKQLSACPVDWKLLNLGGNTILFPV